MAVTRISHVLKRMTRSKPELWQVVLPRPDSRAAAEAHARQEKLTKPPGSLGRLEDVAVRLAGILEVKPAQLAKTVLVFAGDHGVAKHGVSAYPQSVTAQMLGNFDRGGAAINALAASVGASLTVVDVGVVDPPAGLSKVRSHRVRRGTRDITAGPAMNEEEALQAMQVGASIVDERADGSNLIALGEMGIANTTSSSAITSVLCSCSAVETTGPGTGLSAVGIEHKVRVIEAALAVNEVSACDPLGVLTKLGGLETAALVGAMLRAAERRIPVVVDGVTVGAAALIGEAMVPGLREFLFAGHLSLEPAHAIQLRQLGLEAILSLEMRLGEGTGATLALAVIEAAWKAHLEMRTFQEAGVDSRTS